MKYSSWNKKLKLIWKDVLSHIIRDTKENHTKIQLSPTRMEKIPKFDNTLGNFLLLFVRGM